MFPFSTRKVGGLRFVKIGRFSISFCVTRRFEPVKPAEARPAVKRRPASRVVNGRRVLVLSN